MFLFLKNSTDKKTTYPSVIVTKIRYQQQNNILITCYSLKVEQNYKMYLGLTVIQAISPVYSYTVHNMVIYMHFTTFVLTHSKTV